MKQHLNDYDSYQVVNTKTPDTLYKDYLVDDSTGKTLFTILFCFFVAYLQSHINI